MILDSFPISVFTLVLVISVILSKKLCNKDSCESMTVAYQLKDSDEMSFSDVSELTQCSVLLSQETIVALVTRVCLKIDLLLFSANSVEMT